MKKTSSLVIFLIFGLLSACFVACQKEVDSAATPDQNAPAVDSTHLIKSVRLVSYHSDDGMATDSAEDFYDYDTVNGKITITQVSVGPTWSETNSIVASYNEKQQLIGGVYHYSPNHSPDPSDVIAFQISYDADNIVKQKSAEFVDGHTETTNFQKAAVASGGYQLNWKDALWYAASDSLLHEDIFDIKGQHVTSTARYPGHYSYTEFIDYSTAGDVASVNSVYFDSIDNKADEEKTFEVYSRESEGGELYNQKQLLTNGILGLPFFEDDWTNGCTGILSYLPGNYEWMQYAKHPAINGWVNSHHLAYGDYTDFTDSSVFDSQRRLIWFNSGFFDSRLEREDYKITYYK